MFELKPIARQLLLACGSVTSAALLVGPGVVSAQDKDQVQRERVTITGTNIRRTDVETVAPVEIITREAIERTGQATVAEVLRNIPSNVGGSFSESFTNSFAPGASGISLRGLGQKTTLVLINGRRVAGFGFAQNLQDIFVDLNSIPSSAVERVEVLKDGASAIYGSDAIAGVVNVILRRDYKGLEASAGAGYFEGKKDYRASVVGGFGDLGANKYNVFGVLDFYKRDLVTMADTEFGESRDYRDEQGGRNFQSLTGGGTWRQLDPATGALTNNQQAIAECRGTVMTAAQAVEAGLLGVASPFNLPGNTFCTRDFNYAFTALPKTQRIGFLSRGTVDFTPTTQAYAELGLSRVETFQTFQEPFFAGTTGLTQTAAGLRPFTYNITFPSGVAGNPFPSNARYQGVLNDMGTRDLDITSDSARGLAGLKYALRGWELDSAIGYSKNEVESMNINRISLSGTSAVFGVPTTPQPPVPVSSGSSYNLNNPSQNSQAVRDQMRINFPRKSTSKLEFIDTKATTEVGTLPGGPVGFATGVEYRHETIHDRPDPRAAAGEILGQGITATDGSRHQAAVYTELALPFTQTVEMQAALRNDTYSDFGTALTPKLGLKFKPTPEFLIRTNWGRGFRAPTLPEISPSVATFFIQVIDPFNPTTPGGIFQVSGVFAGNPDLKPEKSRSFNFGFVWEPSSNFNVGVDYYEINWKDIVSAPSFQDLVDAQDPRVLRDPATGNIVTILNNFINVNETFTRGTDFDARWIARTTFGRFTTRLNALYVDTFEENGSESAGNNGGSNTIPRWKGYLAVDWDQGPWSVTGRANYIHHYTQLLLPGSFFVPGDPRFQNGTYPLKVRSHTTYDLFARYAFTPKLAVNAAVINVTGEKPPYDPGFSATFLYDFSQYDVRTRQYRIGVTYKFF